ncbi:uncharacterized protein LOC144172537 [Haemaphysalis longicornis]
MATLPSILLRLGFILFVRNHKHLSDEVLDAWKFIGGPGDYMYVMYRNFYNNRNQGDNIKCTMATKLSLNESCHTARYCTKWYNITSGRGYNITSEYDTHADILTATQHYGKGRDITAKYKFLFTDGNCSVVRTPHWDAAAQKEGWSRACEMWVRDGSTSSWSQTCDDVYARECGRRQIRIYNETYCEKIRLLQCHEGGVYSDMYDFFPSLHILPSSKFQIKQIKAN